MDQAENLRTILKRQNQRDISNARIIAVTSGKGGVGKSSVSINLALQFARMGKKVIILDADFGLANIEVMFGIIPKANLSDLMFKGKELKDILVDGPEGVQFISGGSGIAKLANLNKEQIKGMVNKLSELEELADIVIIDTGAGMSSSVMEFLVAAPEIIVVATPEPTSITDSYALLKSMKMYPGYDSSNTRIRIIANKVMTYQEGHFLFEKLEMVVKQFLEMKLEFLGIIPQDNSVSKAVMRQKPVSLMYPKSEAAQSFKCIAESLELNQDLVFRKRNGMRSFLRNVFAKNL